jgi:hypothetical protein
VSLAFGFAICLDASPVDYELFAYPVEGMCNHVGGYCHGMTSWDDDDDWTGTPPEGHHSASQANPGFWADNRTPLSITGVGLGIALIILAIVLLL